MRLSPASMSAEGQAPEREGPSARRVRGGEADKEEAGWEAQGHSPQA